MKRNYPKTLSMRVQARLIEAASDGSEGAKLPRFEMVAYTGDPMRISRWMDPVVLDLSGMSGAARRPVRRNHDPDRLIGHTESIVISKDGVTATGVVSFETPDAQAVVTAAKNGFPWQSSIGWDVDRVEYVAPGATAVVNGKSVTGPMDIVRQSSIREISFVDLGADGNTSVAVAASAQEEHMDPEETDGTQPAPTAAPATVEASAIQDGRKAKADDVRRMAKIASVTKGHPDIEAKAIEEGWTPDRAELECLRTSRPQAPAPVQGVVVHEVLEAAICMTGKLPGVEQKFHAQTLEAAHKRFKHGVSLQEIFIEAAVMAGKSFRSFRADPRAVMEAAFSTVSLAGILSNVTNKFILAGFLAFESTWRRIAKIRPVTDFKTTTSYRMTGNLEYEEIPPSGEPKHGSLADMSFPNQAKNYAKMLSISRPDLINDDMGALTSIPQMLGRGAALKLNKVFWTEFMNNAAFFVAGNNNYFEGAATNLQESSLTTAQQKFREQTDPDGHPLGVAPATLLVPPALEVIASRLVNSLEVRDTTASTRLGTANPFAGKFAAEVSSYLGNALITGNSQTAWYLLANPMDVAAVEMVFLNGQEEPTIETAEPHFASLGIDFLGYHDFGAAKQDHRAGVKSKGAA